MKIKAAEKVVKMFGGNYSYSTFKGHEFICYNTEKFALFPAESKEICKQMKKEGFILQYYAASINGIKLNFNRIK